MTKRTVKRMFPESFCKRLDDGTGFIVWPGKIQPRGCEQPAIGLGKTARDAWHSVKLTQMTTAETVEKAIGLPKGMFNDVLAEVKANRALLEACQRPHDFSICLDRHTKQVIENPTPAQHFGAKWKCSKCGGIVDSIHRIHYQEGLKDANK